MEVHAPRDVPDLYVRVAVGKSIEPEGTAYVVDGRVRVEFKGEVRARLRDGASGRELIVPVRLGPGAGDGRTFRLEVEMTW